MLKVVWLIRSVTEPYSLRVTCVLKLFRCDIVMANISINDLVVILLCGIILLFMIWYSCRYVFNNKKKKNAFDVLTFIQVRTNKKSSYR